MARGIRQFGAIVGSAALAGSMVFGLGGATAAAQTPGTGSQGGTQFERTVDKSTVEVGDEVEVTSTISKDGINAWLVYWMKDLHPECFEYVDGSATWTVSNQTYTQESNPDEVIVSAGAVEINPPLVNSWARPIVMQSRYTVTCAPGPVNSGGLEWNTTNPISGHATFEDAGPSITVEKASSSVSLGTIGAAQTGVSKTLNIFTTKIPDGQTVAIYDGDAEIGQAAVTGGQATYQWTPDTAGAHTISARFGGSDKVEASASQTQTVNVSQSVEASTTTLDVVSGAQVGAQTQLRASVSPAAEGSTVTFKVDNVVVGESPVVGGVATYGWSPLTAGTKTVVAEYSGGSAIGSSVSEAQSVIVAEADPNITETSTTVTAPATAMQNSAVTLSAAVADGSEGATVTFKAGATVIGQGSVDSTGTATIEWTPTAPGPVVITAEYSGDATTAASTGTANVTVEAEPTDPTDPTDPDGSGTGSLSGGSLAALLGMGLAGSLTGSLSGS